MATPPSSAALSGARAPDSFPMGVLAPETITDPGMADLRGHADVSIAGGKGMEPVLPAGHRFYGLHYRHGNERDPPGRGRGRQRGRPCCDADAGVVPGRSEER